MAKYTREEILELPVSGGSRNLRKVASELGLKEVEQGGVLVPIQSARKPALQLAILEVVGNEVEEPVAVENVDGLAVKYWNWLKEYAIGLWRVNPETQEYEYSKPDGGLLNIGRVFVNEVEAIPSNKSDTGTIAPATIKNYKWKVKGRCEALMKADTDPYLQPHKEWVSRVFGELWGYKKELPNGERVYIRGIIDQNVADHTSKKKKAEAKSLLERKENPSHVYVRDLYQWVWEVLGSDDLKPINYRKISIALMLATGRRPAEIHATAKFELSDKPDWVKFSGQLKTKGRSDAEPTYEIPVLAPPAQIIAALEHLDSYCHKRVPESFGDEAQRARKANDTWSSELSQTCKEVDSKVIYKIRSERMNPKTKAVESQRLTCNSCRDIYAQVSTLLYLEPKDRLLQMGKFLGHRVGDSAVTEKYNLDYQVLDTEDELRTVIKLR